MVKYLIYAIGCMIEGVILVCMMIAQERGRMNFLWVVVVKRIRGAKKEVMNEIC